MNRIRQRVQRAIVDEAHSFGVMDHARIPWGIFDTDSVHHNVRVFHLLRNVPRGKGEPAFATSVDNQKDTANLTDKHVCSFVVHLEVETARLLQLVARYLEGIHVARWEVRDPMHISIASLGAVADRVLGVAPLLPG